jgi:hypothetical protein
LKAPERAGMRGWFIQPRPAQTIQIKRHLKKSKRQSVRLLLILFYKIVAFNSCNAVQAGYRRQKDQHV